MYHSIESPHAAPSSCRLACGPSCLPLPAVLPQTLGPGMAPMTHATSPGRSRFDRHSTAAEVCDGINLTGKQVVITGVSSGLGFESMRVLAARGAHVLGLARNRASAAQACVAVGGSTTPLACDLSDLGSVAHCADAIIARDQPLDVLMCNAGIMAPPGLHIKSGLELQFLTNHLGHFLLINRLLPLLTRAAAGRCVIVSSMAHYHSVKGGIDFNNLNGARGYDPWRFYGQSKLANLLTSGELARRLYGSRATANAVHPGIVDTRLGRHTSGVFAKAITALGKPLLRSVAAGAATQCYVAVHRDLRRVNGQYFADCNPARASRLANDSVLARALWDRSIELAAAYL